MILELTTKIDGNGIISRKIIGRIFNMIFFYLFKSCKFNNDSLYCREKYDKILNIGTKFGNADSLNNKGNYYSEKFDESIKKNEKNLRYYNKAIFFYNKSSKLNFTLATENMMYYYGYGIKTKEDINKAINYFQENKHYINTSILYLFNNDYNKANKYYNKINKITKIDIILRNDIFYLYLKEIFEKEIDNKLSKNIYTKYNLKKK